jgi:hypothetical protein
VIQTRRRDAVFWPRSAPTDPKLWGPKLFSLKSIMNEIPRASFALSLSPPSPLQHSNSFRLYRRKPFVDQSPSRRGRGGQSRTSRAGIKKKQETTGVGAFRSVDCSFGNAACGMSYEIYYGLDSRKCFGCSMDKFVVGGNFTFIVMVIDCAAQEWPLHIPTAAQPFPFPSYKCC